MKPNFLLQSLVCVLLACTGATASAQVIIADSFTSVATTNSLWTKDLTDIPSNGETPSLVQDTGAGTLTFSFRPTIISNVDLPANHQGSISFQFEPDAGGSELLSVGLRGSSTRADPGSGGNYGAYYGLTLEFHQYLGQLRLVDYPSSGSASVLGSYAFDFASGETYNFTWRLTGSDLSVTQVGGSTYDFSGVTAGAGDKLFINNSQDWDGLVLYDVSVSAIPEPATYAALAGLLGGCAALYVRRRQRQFTTA